MPKTLTARNPKPCVLGASRTIPWSRQGLPLDLSRRRGLNEGVHNVSLITLHRKSPGTESPAT